MVLQGGPARCLTSAIRRESRTAVRWDPWVSALLAVAAVVIGLAPAGGVLGASCEGRGLSRVGRASDNPIVIENALPGTRRWRLRKPVADDAHKQIKGFATAASVNVGETIGFKVTVSPAQRFTIDIYRIGWYGGTGGRFMRRIGPLAGRSQRPCRVVHARTRLLECPWRTDARLTIPADWVSGLYLGVLRNARGFSNYVTFIVRNDAADSHLLYQASVATWQAYNRYGGVSLYSRPRAYKVSFERPYHRSGTRVRTWDLKMIRWLEREGYDVSYSTDVDTHAHGSRLREHRAFLSVGHNEYWSAEMRDAVESARDQGVDLGFFGGNDSYWQIRFERSPTTDQPNRVIVGYKQYAYLDPVQGRRRTTLWRSVGRAEQQMIGTMFGRYLASHSRNLPLTVRRADHWVFDGTGLENGQRIPDVYGNEYNSIYRRYPMPTSDRYVVLSRTRDPAGGSAATTIYRAPSGAWVFSAGATDWSWLLDGIGRYDHVDRRARRMSRNILDRFTSGPPETLAQGVVDCGR